MTKSKLSKRGGTRRKTRGGKKSIRRNKRGNRKTRHLGKRGKRRTIRRNKRGGYNAIKRAHGRFKGKLGCNPPFIKRASAAGLFGARKSNYQIRSFNILTPSDVQAYTSQVQPHDALSSVVKLPLLQWEEADGSKGSGFISGVKKHEGRGLDGESGAEGEGFALDFVSDIAPPSLSNTPTRTQKTGFNLTNNRSTSKSGWPRQGPITFYWCYSTNNDAPNRDKALEERNAVFKKANTAIKAARETFENAIADQKVPPARERTQEADNRIATLKADADLRKAEAALREAEADLDYATDLAETAKQQASHTVNLDNIQDVLKGEQLIQNATAAAEAAAKKRGERDRAQRQFERLQGTAI